MKLNREYANRSINVSTDKRWLSGFRERIAPMGETEMVGAIDHRLAELAKQELRRRVGAPIPGSASLIERVQEALRVYEEGLL